LIIKKPSDISESNYAYTKTSIYSKLKTQDINIVSDESVGDIVVGDNYYDEITYVRPYMVEGIYYLEDVSSIPRLPKLPIDWDVVDDCYSKDPMRYEAYIGLCGSGINIVMSTNMFYTSKSNEYKDVQNFLKLTLEDDILKGILPRVGDSCALGRQNDRDIVVDHNDNPVYGLVYRLTSMGDGVYHIDREDGGDVSYLGLRSNTYITTDYSDYRNSTFYGSYNHFDRYLAYHRSQKNTLAYNWG